MWHHTKFENNKKEQKNKIIRKRYCIAHELLMVSVVFDDIIACRVHRLYTPDLLVDNTRSRVCKESQQNQNQENDESLEEDPFKALPEDVFQSLEWRKEPEEGCVWTAENNTNILNNNSKYFASFIRPFKIDCMFCVRIFQKSYAWMRKQNTQHEKFYGKLLCVFFVKTKKILRTRWCKTYNQLYTA